jgi:hypothetical protein
MVSTPSTVNLTSTVPAIGIPVRASSTISRRSGRPGRIVRRRPVMRRSASCVCAVWTMFETSMAAPAPVTPSAGSGPGPSTREPDRATVTAVLIRPARMTVRPRPSVTSVELAAAPTD